MLIYASFTNFLRAYSIGDSTMDIRLPTWPAKLMVPLALTVLWLRLVAADLRLSAHDRPSRRRARRGAEADHLETQVKDEIAEALGREDAAMIELSPLTDRLHSAW